MAIAPRIEGGVILTESIALPRSRAPTSPPSPHLSILAEEVGAALQGDPALIETRITAALRTAVTGERWLPPDRRRANHECYARHLLYGDPQGRFSILAIVWDQGQASPIHAHRTWCAFAVYDGSLLETRYAENDEGVAQEISVEVITSSNVAYDRDYSTIHMLGNHGTSPAVSLHIYGVSADKVTTAINKVYRK